MSQNGYPHGFGTLSTYDVFYAGNELLYNGNNSQNRLKSYLADDYSKGYEDIHKPINHKCKMEFVEVM
ncbi:hypothetical protein [Psychroserpens sp.]|uniref:hypothetical protein n=1 Tax=Psychroserpens sp. TaxID=2020870 RepID=UPI002B27290D|nr:hypothetical protein [Psychroserpens sp.]